MPGVIFHYMVYARLPAMQVAGLCYVPFHLYVL